MNRRAIEIACALACIFEHNKNTHHVLSFQIQTSPPCKTEHRPTTKLNEGFVNSRGWGDVIPNDSRGDIKSNHADASSSSSIVGPPSSTSTSTPILSPLQSAWTKYGMIAYVAHMCPFLPLSLAPTYVQTKLGLLKK
eukprot:139849_1